MLRRYKSTSGQVTRGTPSSPPKLWALVLTAFRSRRPTEFLPNPSLSRSCPRDGKPSAIGRTPSYTWKHGTGTPKAHGLSRVKRAISLETQRPRNSFVIRLDIRCLMQDFRSPTGEATRVLPTATSVLTGRAILT